MKLIQKHFHLLPLGTMFLVSTIAYADLDKNNEALVPVIVLDVMDSKNSDSGGGDNCVNIPLISSGSRIVNNVNYVSGSNQVRDITFTSVSETELKTKEITTTSISGTTSSIESQLTLNYAITDDIWLLKSTKFTSGTGSNITTGTATNTPALPKGPIQVFCEGQTWTEPSVTRITERNGTVISTTQTSVSEGIVNSLNETIQVPAGTFVTVLTTLTTADIDNVHKEWHDIITGHIVKVEQYDENGSSLRRTSEATLIE